MWFFNLNIIFVYWKKNICRELPWIVVNCRQLPTIEKWSCRQLSWIVVNLRQLSWIADNRRKVTNKITPQYYKKSYLFFLFQMSRLLKYKGFRTCWSRKSGPLLPAFDPQSQPGTRFWSFFDYRFFCLSICHHHSDHFFLALIF